MPGKLVGGRGSRHHGLGVFAVQVDLFGRVLLRDGRPALVDGKEAPIPLQILESM
jgi:hypothetical protein